MSSANCSVRPASASSLPLLTNDRERGRKSFHDRMGATHVVLSPTPRRVPSARSSVRPANVVGANSPESPDPLRQLPVLWRGGGRHTKPHFQMIRRNDGNEDNELLSGRPVSQLAPRCDSFRQEGKAPGMATPYGYDRLYFDVADKEMCGI